MNADEKTGWLVILHAIQSFPVENCLICLSTNLPGHIYVGDHFSIESYCLKRSEVCSNYFTNHIL